MNNSTAVVNSSLNTDVVDQSVRLMLEDFLNDYCHQLDDGNVDAWTGFFADDGRYQVTTRENVEAGYPLGIIYCEGRGMMEDRIRALKTANIYEKHDYCHTLGRPHIWREDCELYRVRVNFILHRTMHDGKAELFATGKYLDLISHTPTGLAFKERRVIIDSRRIDTLLVVPI
jgi:anthranilate 1,2-dioxygenase small subunit